MSEPTEAPANYVTTKEECERNIKGVCEGCGRSLTAIETVDNSIRPTFWQGCKHCSCFRAGIEFEYFTIARKLVEDGEIIPYSHLRRCEYENTPERLGYYLDSQTAGLSHRIKKIHKLLETDNSTAELEAEVESLKHKFGETFQSLSDARGEIEALNRRCERDEAEVARLGEECKAKDARIHQQDAFIRSDHEGECVDNEMAQAARIEQLEGALRDLSPRLLGGWGPCWCDKSPESANIVDHQDKCSDARRVLTPEGDTKC